MRKSNVCIAVLCLLLSFSVLGCAQKKAASSQEAIETSKQLKTVDEQVHYLVGQANAFINGKEFNDAITTAQYVVSNLDQNSAEAKSLIERAKAEMQKAAQGAVNDMKSKLNSLGK